MRLKSKFDISDEIYYWSIDNVQIMQGTTTGLSVFVVQKNDDINISWKYCVKPSNGENPFYSEMVPEHLVFREREDVFEFCMALTKNI